MYYCQLYAFFESFSHLLLLTMTLYKCFSITKEAYLNLCQFWVDDFVYTYVKCVQYKAYIYTHWRCTFQCWLLCMNYKSNNYQIQRSSKWVFFEVTHVVGLYLSIFHTLWSTTLYALLRNSKFFAMPTMDCCNFVLPLQLHNLLIWYDYFLHFSSFVFYNQF